MDIVCFMREDCYHHMDSILQLGEISDRLYFVTKGKVGVFVNAPDAEKYSHNLLQEGEAPPPRKSKGLLLLGYLNVGSNFNHFSAILSQQSILTFRALGQNTQIASITKDNFIALTEQY